MIPYGRQEITDADIESVVSVLKSDFLTQGQAVPMFEGLISAYCGARYAVAVNSATSALHLACIALGLQPGDRLWTSDITFVASANCGLYCGAEIDLVDIDPKTYNLCPIRLEEKLAAAAQKGKLPKILVAVHLCGQSCDMATIRRLSEKYGFAIIEDASHAIGGRYQDEPIGSCRYSDVTVFSFHPVKIITTAEGGIAVTNREDLAHRMSMLRSHGITRNPADMTHAPDGPWYYQQIALGFNYRMTELQAALGISQFNRLDDYVLRRHALAKKYDALLADLPIMLPWQHPATYSAFHLYVIRLQLDRIRTTHREVFEGLRARGIGVNLHYIPLHTQPYYQRFGFSPENFPQAHSYYAEAISLPLYPALEEHEQQKVIDTLHDLLT